MQPDWLLDSEPDDKPLDEGKPKSLVDVSESRKEVIQPQVPLRLPCYDFAPVTGHTIGGYLPCGLVHRLPVQQASMA